MPTAAIRTAREARGLSKAKLAQLVGVSRPCVGYWERGRSRPRPRHAELLEAILGLQPGSLNGNDDGPEQENRRRTHPTAPEEATNGFT